MGIHEDLQGFMRLWERICGDLQLESSSLALLCIHLTHALAATALLAVAADYTGEGLQVLRSV